MIFYYSIIVFVIRREIIMKIDITPIIDNSSVKELLLKTPYCKTITEKDICWECVIVNGKILLKAVSLLF